MITNRPPEIPTHFQTLAGLPTFEGRAMPESAATLREELLLQRFTQTDLWALPLFNTLGMQLGSEQAFDVGYNVPPNWKRRLDARTEVTTVHGKGWFTCIHLCGPIEPSFDHSWKPGDFEPAFGVRKGTGFDASANDRVLDTVALRCALKNDRCCQTRSWSRLMNRVSLSSSSRMRPVNDSA